jgi:uncharacterized membrane protein YidH (DUF202 family)
LASFLFTLSERFGSITVIVATIGIDRIPLGKMESHQLHHLLSDLRQLMRVILISILQIAKKLRYQRLGRCIKKKEDKYHLQEDMI